MRKIGILASSFLSWNGGFDLLKKLMSALSCLPAEKENRVVFIRNEKTHGKYKGVRKYLTAFKEEYLTFQKFHQDNEAGEIFGEMKRHFLFVRYATKKELEKAIAHYAVEVAFPCASHRILPLSVPTVGYIPDCQHRYYPAFFSKNEMRARDRGFSSLIKKSDHLMITAKTVRNDLINFYGANPESVTILPFSPFIEESFFTQNDESIIDDYELPENYFMISNQFWLHKDHATAFKALAICCENAKFEGINCKLLCTGLAEDYRDKDYIFKLKKLVSDLGLNEKIIFLGFIPKKDQLAIMRHAIAVLQPTLFEGGPGGGAVSDALSLGVRCIISDIDTNREIESEKISFFRAGSPDSLAEKMLLVLKRKREFLDVNTQILRNRKNQEKLGKCLVEMLEKA